MNEAAKTAIPRDRMDDDRTNISELAPTFSRLRALEMKARQKGINLSSRLVTLATDRKAIHFKKTF